MTLFPEAVAASLKTSILDRGEKKGILDIRCVQIRDYTDNRQQQVDDYPYGGGWGCVMMAQPLKACLDAVCAEAGERKRRVIYLSPQGKTFDQAAARRLASEYDHLVLVCGHYEGVDERFIEACVDEELSLGDFVLTGGEIAAMAVTDAVCRLVPGVLSDEECFTGESHWDGLLEYPQYTRPEVWEGRAVPEVLLNGDHARIEHWRRKQQFFRTKEKRPDLYAAYKAESEEDKKLMKEAEKDAGRKKLTAPVTYRPAVMEDIPRILEIVQAARESLGRFGIDQWQGPYPGAERFEEDIRLNQCFIVEHAGDTGAFFVLSTLPEPSYDDITDGKWSADVPCCVLHRAAVAREYRGSGMSQALMRCADEQARRYGLKCIRVDTHRKNKPMQNLLRESGYRYRGNILVDAEPGHDPHRQAFEKLLKDKK